MNELQTKEKVMSYELPTGDTMELTVSLVKNYLITGNKELVTPQEIIYYMHTCKALKVNPFMRECYLIKYSGREAAQIITSVQHIRDLAMAHPLCEGWTVELILWNEESRSIEYTNGLVFPGTKVFGARFKARPKGWKTMYVKEIMVDAYIKKTKEGRPTQFWSKEKQPMMIMKVAESQGLRAIFGESTRGLLIKEETGNEEPISPQQPEIAQPQAPQLMNLGTPEKAAIVVSETKPEPVNLGNQDMYKNLRCGNFLDEPDPGRWSGLSGFVYRYRDQFSLLDNGQREKLLRKWKTVYSSDFILDDDGKLIEKDSSVVDAGVVEEEKPVSAAPPETDSNELHDLHRAVATMKFTKPDLYEEALSSLSGLVREKKTSDLEAGEAMAILEKIKSLEG